MSALALVTDLFFVSKIKSTADALGIPPRILRNLDDLKKHLEAGVSLAIVDMNATGVAPADAVKVCKTAASPPYVIAYLSHVQRELAVAAGDAGADLVLPRSRFSAELPDLLKKHAG